MHLSLAEYTEARERYAEALPIYRAIGDRLGEANCIKSLGDVHAAKDDDEAALDLYEQATSAYRSLALAERQAGVLTSMADLYGHQKDYGSALTMYARAIELAPENPMWYRNRAWAYVHFLEDAASARIDLERAAKLQPEHPYLLLGRGDLALLERDYGRALIEYEAFVAARPRDNGGLFGRGLAYVALGQLDRSIESYEQALSLTTDHHDIDEAIESLQRLLGRHPSLTGSARVLSLLAQARTELLSEKRP